MLKTNCSVTEMLENGPPDYCYICTIKLFFYLKLYSTVDDDDDDNSIYSLIRILL